MSIKCFCVQSSAQKFLQGLKWGTFLFCLPFVHFLSKPQLLFGLQQCEIKLTLPLTTRVLERINVKESCIQNKGDNFPNDHSSFLPFSHPFLPIPQHRAVLLSLPHENSTLWTASIIKSPVMTNDWSQSFLFSPHNGCSMYCAVLKNKRVEPLQELSYQFFPQVNQTTMNCLPL